jgi:hypothetical protein
MYRKILISKLRLFGSYLLTTEIKSAHALLNNIIIA